MDPDSFETHEPTKSLRPFVHLIWAMRIGQESPAGTFSVLPHGLNEVVLHAGAHTRIRVGTGNAQTLPRQVLAGALSRRIDLAITGGLEAVGVQFLPGAVAAFGLVRPFALANIVTPLEWLIGTEAESLHDSVFLATSPRERATVIETWLLGRYVPPDATATAVRSAAEIIMRQRGNIRVAELCRRIGVGRRSLERAFMDRVGLTPKVLCEVLRFQAALHAKQSEGLDWSAVASLCGYSDQAHLVREFRRFAGVPPKRLMRRLNPITACLAGLRPLS